MPLERRGWAMGVYGAITGLGAVLGPVLGGATAGWLDPAVLVALAVGVLALCVLVACQRRAARPMIPVRLFGDRGFSSGNAAIFVANASLTAADRAGPRRLVVLGLAGRLPAQPG